MMGVREFLNTPAGKAVSVGFILLALSAAAYSVYSNFGESDEVAASRYRTFIDAKTGEAFEAEMQIGWRVPVPAPSGGNTGYPAEMCYWTTEGTVADRPTPVLLNHYVGKQEPTFCPDCGRLVVERNPVVLPGMEPLPEPPPLKSEYVARK